MVTGPCARCAHNCGAPSANIQGVTTQPSETQRVATELTRRIRDMQAGAEVGSLRSVATTYGVSVDVARKAFALLVRHGLVRAEARRHVVADPGVPLTEAEVIADLRLQVADHEARLRALEQRKR
jgi:DNA-binding GntR family transcriptional regulator